MGAEEWAEPNGSGEPNGRGAYGEGGTFVVTRPPPLAVGAAMILNLHGLKLNLCLGSVLISFDPIIMEQLDVSVRASDVLATSIYPFIEFMPRFP